MLVRRKLVEVVVLPLKYLVKGNSEAEDGQGSKNDCKHAEKPLLAIPCSPAPASQVELPTRHYFPLSASTFATYVKVKNPEYFAIRPVSRPQNGRQVPLRMAKRRRTAATGLGARLLTEGPGRRHAFRTGWLALVLLILFCRIGSAESTEQTEFLPEVDAYLKLNPDIRVGFHGEGYKRRG